MFIISDRFRFQAGRLNKLGGKIKGGGGGGIGGIYVVDKKKKLTMFQLIRHTFSVTGYLQNKTSTQTGNTGERTNYKISVKSVKVDSTT